MHIFWNYTLPSDCDLLKARYWKSTQSDKIEKAKAKTKQKKKKSNFNFSFNCSTTIYSNTFTN